MASKYPGWSPFNYCLDNPLNNFDPDGRWPFSTKLKRFITIQEVRKMAWDALKLALSGKPASIDIINVRNPVKDDLSYQWRGASGINTYRFGTQIHQNTIVSCDVEFEFAYNTNYANKESKFGNVEWAGGCTDNGEEIVKIYFVSNNEATVDVLTLFLPYTSAVTLLKKYNKHLIRSEYDEKNKPKYRVLPPSPINE